MTTDKKRAGARELGALLREYRERSNTSMRELSERIGRGITFIHRLEMGDRAAVSETEIIHFLAGCGVNRREIDRMVAQARDAYDKRGYWMIRGGPWMSDSLRSLIFHEATAQRQVNYEPEVIPGLLQTKPYVEAILRSENLTASDREARVHARLERQRIMFRNNPAKFTFIINERSLRLEIGDFRIMTEQLLAMMFFVDRWNISIRIVPTSARERGLFGGQFIYFDYDDCVPLVYNQTMTAGFFIEDPKLVLESRTLIHQMVDLALDEGDSRALIARLADEYDRREGSWDDQWRLAQEQL